MVKEFVAIYNHERSHLALKYKTPDEVHQPFYGQKTVNLYQEQLKPGAYFHERRSLNNSPISFTVIRMHSMVICAVVFHRSDLSCSDSLDRQAATA